MRLVLASRSPRRQVLLRMLLDAFETRPMDVTEEAPHALSVPDALEVIARKKALAASRLDREAWVLGADTVAVFRGTLMGKARSAPEARLRLAMLSDDVHEVTTGIALAHGGKSVAADAVTTSVRFARLPPGVVDRYVDEQMWVSKAGGYGIQDPLLAPYITIGGPWSNVVGLPLGATAALLRGNGLPCRDPPDEVWLSHHNPFDRMPGSVA